ncbi:hypothetical protein C2845_PM06G15020 [Panicum miliaceum]|uniref:Pentatricopeptide repeat-containing protein n=1 Tax=Panicum miliaceum TaxID=4540 RepID=A0A3L6RFV9_PANMI|nr:hypothetical protein C2845_PM06G15020 [Panicum miliaceum]
MRRPVADLQRWRQPPAAGEHALPHELRPLPPHARLLPAPPPTRSPTCLFSAPRAPGDALALATHSPKFLGAEARRPRPRPRVRAARRLRPVRKDRRVPPGVRQDPQHDLPAWTALMAAYARLARVLACATRRLEVVELFPRPVSSSAVGVTPNEVMLAAVISARGEVGALVHGVWAHAYFVPQAPARRELIIFLGIVLLEMYARGCGRIDLAEQVFAGVADRDRALRMHCMVDMLSRAGRLDDAEHGYVVAPNAATYRSVIQASGIHGKLELGKIRMMKELVELEPEHSGNYVSVVQLLCENEPMGWEDAKKTRKEMKAMGINKSLGSSVLDTDRDLHELLMDDGGTTAIHMEVYIHHG